MFALFTRLFAFLRETMLDGDKAGFGRVWAIPFLFSSWALQTAQAIVSIVNGQSVIEECVTMAAIAITLYTGSKMLTIKGKTVELGSGPATASTSSPATPEEEAA
jgi:hypothetical protein